MGKYRLISSDIKRKKAGQIPLFDVPNTPSTVISQSARAQTRFIVPPLVTRERQGCAFTLFPVPAAADYSLRTGYKNSF